MKPLLFFRYDLGIFLLWKLTSSVELTFVKINDRLFLVLFHKKRMLLDQNRIILKVIANRTAFLSISIMHHILLLEKFEKKTVWKLRHFLLGSVRNEPLKLALLACIWFQRFLGWTLRLRVAYHAVLGLSSLVKRSVFDWKGYSVVFLDPVSRVLCSFQSGVKV